MKLLRANQDSKENIDLFLKNNADVDQNRLIQDGHVVKKNDQIIGCFILEPIKTDVYCLKQLYITQSEAAILPLLLESILALAKDDQAKEVCVKSHQPMVDIILEALQFQPAKQVKKHRGRWWTYNVC